MFGLDSAINTVIDRLSGGKKGEIVRARSLLSTDRIVSLAMIMVPLLLLIFTEVFTPSVFKFGSINCNMQMYRSQADGAVVKSGWDNRHYFHRYCWERATHAYPNSNYTDDAILWHKNFPYTLLALTALASFPLILWTFVAGTHIKPEVELFGEFLEAVVKFLFRAVRNNDSVYDFELYRKSHNEKIMGQFSQLAHFMKTKSSGHKLLVSLVLYRILNIIALCGTIVLVYLTSIQKERSLFTCECKFTDAPGGTQSLLCSVQGVGVRIWLSWLWVIGYGLLVCLLILGSVSDYRAMAYIHEEKRLLDLFKIIWPNKFLDANTAHTGPDDLKFIMLLASKNLQGNVFISAAFSFLERAKLCVEHDVNTDYKKRFLTMMRQAVLDADEDDDVNRIIKSLGN